VAARGVRGCGGADVQPVLRLIKLGTTSHHACRSELGPRSYRPQVALAEPARVIVQAVLAQSATELPVVALLDADESGKHAQSQLEGFGWSKTREIVNLGTWPGKCAHGHDVEIEDLIPSAVSEKIVKLLGESAAVTAKRQCNGKWHYEFSDAWKQRAVEELPNLLKPMDTGGLVWLAELLSDRLRKVQRAKDSAGTHRQMNVAM
ncbi:hypothetical protein KV113_11065, partial [Mycolicibacter sp. MYC340]|nr:hypothetical protein [Mycolicibacter sp. MYC340]